MNRAKGFLLLATVLLLSSLAVAADDASKDPPKGEIFGSFSYLRVNPGSGLTGVNTYGWEASGNYNLNRWLGLKADFDGHYCCNGGKVHDFLFGPQLSYRASKATLFVHGLGGASHGNAFGASATAGAWDMGGGVDWKLSKHLAWRIAQADYIGTRFVGATQHNFRTSTGLVFRFGEK